MARRKSVKRKLPKLGKEGFVTSTFATPGVADYVVAELRYESPVAYTKSRFVAPAVGADDANRFNQVLEKFAIKEIRSQFGFPAAQVRKRVQLAAALPSDPSTNILKAKGADAEFRQSGFVQIVPKRSEDCKKLAAALSREKSVWQAYVAPRPVPAGVSGSSRRNTTVRTGAGLPLFSSGRNRRGRRVEPGRCKRKERHDLRYRRRVEHQARGLALGHYTHRRNDDRRPRLAQSRHRGARRDDLAAEQQGLRRDQSRSQGDRPFGGRSTVCSMWPRR